MAGSTDVGVDHRLVNSHRGTILPQAQVSLATAIMNTASTYVALGLVCLFAYLSCIFNGSTPSTTRENKKGKFEEDDSDDEQPSKSAQSLTQAHLASDSQSGNAENASGNVRGSASDTSIKGGQIITAGASVNILTMVGCTGIIATEAVIPQTQTENGHLQQATTARSDPTRGGMRPQQDPTGRVHTSNKIYEQHLREKGRGHPLWIPQPNMALPIAYRAKGVRIGDVGIFTDDGGFDFLFNICVPIDHPINPRKLPENFVSLYPSVDLTFDICKFPQFTSGSYLASSSVTESRTAEQSSGLTFESSASEGAILTMPDGAQSESLMNLLSFETYIGTHVQNWYKYVNGPSRGRKARNGDLRVVVGHDKSTSWGMATFSNSSLSQDINFRLKFTALENQSSSANNYEWEYSGVSVAEARVGPGPGENKELGEMDSDRLQNQCLFIRSLHVELSEQIWREIFPQTVFIADQSDHYSEIQDQSTPFPPASSTGYTALKSSQLQSPQSLPSRSHSSTTSSASSENYGNLNDLMLSLSAPRESPFKDLFSYNKVDENVQESGYSLTSRLAAEEGDSNQRSSDTSSTFGEIHRDPTPTPDVILTYSSPGKGNLHPSQIISQYLFEQVPDAKVAITHDRDWSGIDTHLCHLDSSQLLLAVRSRNDIVLDNDTGLVFLELKEKDQNGMLSEEVKVAGLVESIKDGKFTLDQYLFGFQGDHCQRLEDLSNALRYGLATISMSSFLIGHPERPLSLDEILKTCNGDFHVQERQSISSLRAELTSLPPQRADRSTCLLRLADALSRRFSQWAQTDDLEEAISSYEVLLSLIPIFHYQYLEALLGLCSSLYQRFYLLNQADDLNNLLKYLTLQYNVLALWGSQLLPSAPLADPHRATFQQLLSQKLSSNQDLSYPHLATIQPSLQEQSSHSSSLIHSPFSRHQEILQNKFGDDHGSWLIPHKYLLQMCPQSEVALTHDDTWSSIFQEVDDDELLERINISCDIHESENKPCVFALRNGSETHSQSPKLEAVDSTIGHTSRDPASHALYTKEPGFEDNVALHADVETQGHPQPIHSQKLQSGADPLVKSAIPTPIMHQLEEPPVRKRAFLIGINKYRHLPEERQLRGCIQDVELLSDLLQSRFEFDQSNIFTLLDEHATRDGILKAFTDFIATVQRDDIVVVQYCGHGSYMVDATKGSGWTETIVPHDSGRAPTGYPSTDIKDVEINEFLLQPLVSKTSNLTLLFDTCHSGSVIRDNFASVVRSISPDGEIRRNPGGGGAARSGWPLEKYTLLAACRADEGAHETFSDGVTYGAFTYQLCSLIKESRNEKLRTLFQVASATVTAHYPSQHPILEGCRDGHIFGTDRLETLPFLTVVRIFTTDEKQEVQMDGGLASGVTLHSVWAARPLGVSASKSDVHVQVHRLCSFESYAHIVSEGTIQPGFQCFEISHVYGEASLTVHTDEQSDEIHALFQTPNVSGVLKRFSDTEGAAPDVKLVFLKPRSAVAEGDMAPQLGPLKNGTWIVLAPDGGTLLPPTTKLDDVFENLRGLARYQFGLKLRNVDEDSKLRGKLSLTLRKRANKNDTWRDAIIGEDGFPLFCCGEQIACVITNNSDYRVYPHILEFAEDGSVSQRYPGRGGEEGLDGGSSTKEVARMTLNVSTHSFFQLAGDRFPARGDERRRKRVTEVLKLFASTERIDLSLLLHTSFAQEDLRHDHTPHHTNNQQPQPAKHKHAALAQLLQKPVRDPISETDHGTSWETVNAPFVLET